MTATASASSVSVASSRQAGEGSEQAEGGAKAELWDAVIRAGDDMDRLVARAVSVQAAGGSNGFVTLRDDLRARLEELRAEIRAVADSERVMLILIFHFDERVMRQLPDTTRLRWTPLQVDWLGTSHGGAEFYRILDRLLQDQGTRALLFEIFYYCLNNGFLGKYAGNPEAIERYKEQVKARIPVPEAGVPEAGKTEQKTSLPRQWPASWYVAGTALIVVALVVISTMLTNC